jgi:hypothetical protein
LRPSFPAWIRILIIILAVTILGVLYYTNYQFVLREPGGNDFLARWMGAKSWLVDGLSPYDPEVSLQSQEIIYGRPARPEDGEDIAHFVYPLPAMIFFGPFGLIPYTIARAIWMTLLEIALPLLTWVGIRLSGWKPSRFMMVFLLVFSVLWYHGFRAVILGQFAVFEALLMAGSLLAIQQKQDGLAGILLALSISKPQMSFLFIPFVILWAVSKKRWSLILWSAGSFVFIIGISVLLMPDWPLQWIRQVLSYPDYSPARPPVAIIADLFPMFSSWINLAGIVIFVLYMIWEWILALQKDDRWFQWTAAMTILITNLIVVRTATTNYLAMVPGLMFLFSVLADRWKKKGSAVVVTILITLLIGLWALFLTTIDGNIEGPAMYLPFPIFLLFSLWWIRWWFIRPIRLPLEL